MSHSEHAIHIAPYASNVHVHIYNSASAQQAPTNTPYATPPITTRVPRNPRPQEQETTRLFPTTASVVNHPRTATESFANQNDDGPSQPSLQTYLRMLQRLGASDNRAPATQRTDPSIRVNGGGRGGGVGSGGVGSGSGSGGGVGSGGGGERVSRLTGISSGLTRFQDLMSRIRQRGQQDGYTVSFELGTLDEVRRRGTSVEELTAHTTLGLYQDLETGSDDEVDENKADESECETCSICQEQFTPRCIVRQIDRCNHYFHQACIEKWLGDHTTCPLCMQEIAGEEEAGDTNTNATGTETATTEANRVQERLLNLVADELGM